MLTVRTAIEYCERYLKAGDNKANKEDEVILYAEDAPKWL